GALGAANAPVLDDHLLVVATVDRADGAADHAQRVEAGAAGVRHQVAVEPRAVEEQPAAAVVVGTHARLDALVAARAAVQVDQHEPLPLDQAHAVRPGRADQGAAGVLTDLGEPLLCPAGALRDQFLHVLAT